MKINQYLFLLVLVLYQLGTIDNPLYAQTKRSRAELEKEKAEVLKRLEEFDKILEKTAARKKNTISELNVVNRQLETRANYINTLNNEVLLLNQEIKDTQNLIQSLKEDLEELKEEYAQMIYTSSKLNSGVTVLSFIFSSSTFKQFYMRLKYLKQYSDARKKQVDQINKVSADLEKQNNQLEKQKSDKQLALEREQEQKKELASLKQEQQQIVNNLSQKEEEIRKDIKKTKKQQEELNRLIRKVIEEEIRLAEAEAKKANSRATKSAGTNVPLTPESAALSNSFAENKGNMPWPVASGFISRRFGTHPHPTLRGITETNDGVDIQTNPDETVRAVFSGTVTKISTVPGMGGTIIIRHGEYYTMYSRLRTISVKSGQKVAAREKIGEVSTGNDGTSEVHFQTWKGLKVMNPTIWLSSN
ncbi:peptidoglycan DD-metalloendopeptidase family protein [Echinicola jeungdonensis]|uniref:Murein hydrolase activator EnvC family protein n=1 Tax=Echinicola jeungdonensis TaxID=709343 RepID=A0ABV5J638_9BACT|nr:peptidoglycan DD-metalloendopeptidase family protein [Echinicola jeungdonensis]MDN3668064.1 peptidoglycan DD-metalloendopeptidase family protein [Echinicola jeungdonensis]